MFCPNCGWSGKPKRLTPGSFAVELLLWLAFILPGLIYSVWRLAARYYGCPECENKNIIPSDSPVAKAAMARITHSDAPK